MARKVAPHSADQKCPKGYHKLIFEVKNSDDDGAIRRAAVTVTPSGKTKGCTLRTNTSGQVVFKVKRGSYDAKVEAPNTHRKQAPKKPFEEKVEAGIAVKKADQTKEIKLAPIPMVKVFLKLVFKDPEDVERGFRGTNPRLVFSDGTEQKLKFDKGVLLGEDGQPGLDLRKELKTFKLAFKKPSSPYSLSCEARGKSATYGRCTKSAEAESAKHLAKHRVFRLPDCDWGLDDKAKWTVSEDGGAYKTDTFLFDIENAGDALGTVDAPVKALLDPRWQFVRLTYFDRIIAGDKQVSSLPLLLDGYAEKPPHAPTADKLTTRAKWDIGTDDKETTFCIPWILYDSSAEKPDKDSELRFETKANTFIKTADDESRTLEVGKQDTPSAERLRYYDLPKEWRSRNWFVRTQPKGTDITEGKFLWELDTVEKVRGTKDKPLIFSLDDIVLYTKDRKTPLGPLDKKTALAVFHNSFKTGTDLSNEGVYLPEAEVVPRDGQLPKDTYYPASKVEVLGRKSDGDAHTELKENYLVKYPDWTRLVTCAGNLYDCFSERSVAKDGEDRVVGARAAVAWVDATAQISGKDPVPGEEIAQRPKAVGKTFCVVQPYVEMEAPVSHERRDSGTSGGKGSATSAADLGPLLASRVDRDPDRAQEWSTNQKSDGGIGRWDLCLLRCCGVDPNDATKEVAVLFNYFRISVKWKGSCTYNTAAKKAWMKREVDNLATRWNGPDAAFNAGRPRVEPRDQNDAPSPLTVEVLRFFQMNPDAQADCRVQVVAAAGGRDWMAGAIGLTQSSEGNEAPGGDGDLTSAHEIGGHGGGLVDDYCELWDHASYQQPALAMLVPGDPYMKDDVDGAQSMMHGNMEVRARHNWHLADWLHTMLDDLDLQVIHGSGDPDPFCLPHHPRNSKTGRKFRSYLMFPFDTVLDAGLPKQPSGVYKSRFDAYLWLLGKDVYSQTILPGKSGPAATQVDGVLVVAVNIGFDYLGTTDHDWIRSTTANLVNLLQKTFGYRAVAKFTVGGHTFERCLIHIAPRIVVGTHAGNDKYDEEVGATATEYDAGEGYSEGALVTPSTGANGFWYECTYLNPTAPGFVWNSSVEPAWPVAAGGTVDDGGNIRWVAMTEADGKAKGYANVIKKEVKKNQLHVILQVGTPDSEVTTVAGELPRIKVKSGDLTDIAKAVKALAEAIKTVLLKVVSVRQQLVDEINAHDQEITRLAGEVATAAGNRDYWVNDKAGKTTQRTALGTRVGNEVEWDRLTGEIATAENGRSAWATEHSRLDGLKTTEQTNRDAKFNRYTPLNDFYANQRQAVRIVNVLDKTKTMVETLFTDEGDPMEDPFYRELVGARAQASTAAGQPNATRGTVIAAITARWPKRGSSTRYSLTPKLKEALGELPNLESTTATDTSNVASAIITVAEKIQAFANAGANAPAKFSRARQAKVVVTAGHTLAAADLQDSLGACGDTVNTERRKDVMNWIIAACAPWKEASKAPTLEEQFQSLFATYLGVEVDKGSIVGFENLVKPFADAPEITLAVPAPPPLVPAPIPDPPVRVLEPEPELVVPPSDPPKDSPSETPPDSEPSPPPTS